MRISKSILFLLLSSHCFSQNNNLKCSQILLKISKEWQRDSLGSDGFRAQVFEELRHSIIDTVSKDFLLNLLGKPNGKFKFYSGITNKNYVAFSYFYLTPKVNDYPKTKPSYFFYIEFEFDEKEMLLRNISDGDGPDG